MKRMTISLLVTAVILAVGTAAIWMLFTARRPQPTALPVTPPPSLAAVVKKELGFDITRQQTGSSGFVGAPETPAAP